ncbi:MAG: type II toxin-antitoxin system YoeB family toxin [Arcobacteraceae bacterium]|nr:type II toxin-antitoxin system YoeB family toxin [Arcobacteraceae bacterium]
MTIEHRLVYKVTQNAILIAQCRYHYYADRFKKNKKTMFNIKIC